MNRLTSDMKTNSDPTLLVLRNRARFEGQSLLVVDPPSLGTVNRMAGAFEIKEILTRDYGLNLAAAQTERNYGDWSFGIVPRDDSDCEVVLVFVPKGRELLDLTLASLAARTRKGTSIYVVGGNRTGIKSADELMKIRFGVVRKIDAARHCQMLGSVTGDQESRELKLDEWTRRFKVNTTAGPLSIVSLPGVFSHGELDDGSSLLMQYWKPGNPRRILDVGCGSGVLGATLATTFREATVTMVDNHASALESSTRTLATNNIQNAEVVPSNLFEQVSGRFDLIVSNPPFHAGHDSDRVTSYRMIRQAATHLDDGGSLQIVCNTFLPYIETLRETFSEVQTLYRGRRYRVYLARGPRS